MTGWGVGRAHWDQESKASAGTVMRTDDSGETWTAQNTGTAQDLWDICFTDRLNGWAVGDSGTLIRTSDGGETWTKQPVGTDLNFKSLSFSDESNGWILANEVIHTSWLGEPNGWQARIWPSISRWRRRGRRLRGWIVHWRTYRRNGRGNDHWKRSQRKTASVEYVETPGAIVLWRKR